MTEHQYKLALGWLRAHPQPARAIIRANQALTACGYILYPVLLAMLAVSQPPLLARALIVPAVSFALVTAFRALADAPRPYDILDIQPLIPKDTQGRSFPSRHAFSLSMIACTWFLQQPAIGVGLLLAGVLLGGIRVICGLHWPRDVAVGILTAIACAAFGFLVIP